MASPSNHESKSIKAYRDFTRTPRWVFEAFNSMYQYDLDAAALECSALLPNYYTPKQDSLSRDWSSENEPKGKFLSVWLNPPFSNIYPWVEKVLEQQEKGVLTTLFVPHENRAKWWPAGLPCKIIDIVGYYKDLGVYKSGVKKGAPKKRWCSGGIKFVDARTGLENKHELNKPMSLIEFHPNHIGKPTTFGYIQKNVLMAMAQQSTES
ncbi:DNA N-6-adenine-methyltransferase [Pseudoalteromonas ruthenica]|uniref:DNA N-6-adenine-methyltransferase n=1 Tax=Pseudoalteromonas ruthenica TaxID=151081 RepID=UPI00110B45EA|nr:DNA N-6-adenine-methyltransferase [Pseudoalteromonas ruthenica]TMP23753.1 adenine methyltransferase [Pseudoalteromonas ruthenica]